MTNVLDSSPDKNGSPRRWQMHLSTAVVLMFVAGGVIWANVTEKRDHGWSHFWNVTSFEPNYTDRLPKSIVFYGWPLYAVGAMQKGSDKSLVFNGFLTDHVALVFDIFVFNFMLAAAWFVCEWRIRRQSARTLN